MMMFENRELWCYYGVRRNREMGWRELHNNSLMICMVQTKLFGCKNREENFGE